LKKSINVRFAIRCSLFNSCSNNERTIRYSLQTFAVQNDFAIARSSLLLRAGTLVACKFM